MQAPHKNHEVLATNCHPLFKYLCPLRPGAFASWDEQKTQWCLHCRKTVHFIEKTEDLQTLQVEQGSVCVAIKEANVIYIGKPLTIDADLQKNTSRFLAESESAEDYPFSTPPPIPLPTTCRDKKCPHAWNDLKTSDDDHFSGRCRKCNKHVILTDDFAIFQRNRSNKRTVTVCTSNDDVSS